MAIEAVTALRRAAELLRDATAKDAVTEGDWTWAASRKGINIITESVEETFGVADDLTFEDAFYITVMHPPVGRIIADLLEQVATQAQTMMDTYADEQTVEDSFAMILELAREVIRTDTV